MTAARLSYAESAGRLLKEGWLDDKEVPPIPERMPRHDDEEPLGVSFFRMLVRELDCTDMTLPRTFVGRSEIAESSFRNADLHESNFCWNDFIKVDFSGADLRDVDMRCLDCSNCDFSGADLRGADLRHSNFTDCRFAGANFTGARVTRSRAAPMRLTAAQSATIAWTDTDGPEPDGG